MKELAPVRLIRNGFYQQVQEAYAKGATVEELKSVLGRGRAKRGMFEGDLELGELEIGQASARLRDVLPAATIVANMIREYTEARSRLANA